MKIELAPEEGKKVWNDFIRRHYPPVGGFMQAWEWGDFQKKMGRTVDRYFVFDRQKPVAAFTLVHYRLPYGFRYAYAPRGPVVAEGFEGRMAEICFTIRGWAKERFPELLFLRLEPPSVNAVDLPAKEFRFPSYYIQPRHNHVIDLDKAEEEILRALHPSTRSNLNRAKRRGVSAFFKPAASEEDLRHFNGMVEDTIERNSGKKAYPHEAYFKSFFSEIPASAPVHDPSSLTVGGFFGYQHDEPASTHFVLFFGDTATYIYGASYSRHLNSKVTTYLHWSAILEAKRRGMKYYDLGGVDEARWPSLTEFKRQFRGREISYIGNIDIPIRPLEYRFYNLFKLLRSGLDRSVLKIGMVANPFRKETVKKAIIALLILTLGAGVNDLIPLL